MRYAFDATCADCSGEMQHITGGRVISGETSAVAKCLNCGSEWLFRLVMAAVARRIELPGERRSPSNAALCGTDSGYHKHKRERTEKCGPCKAAHNAEAVRSRSAA